MSFRRLAILVFLVIPSLSSAGGMIPAPRDIRHGKGCFKARDIQSSVHFEIADTIPAEGYSISVRKRGITVRYSDSAGRLYACQTLESLSSGTRRGKTAVPCCDIYDYPRVSWRGLLLDSGRQYQSPETIKKYLDLLFSLKMNVFHWHLTEGLGWRLEIKKYPRLAGEGGSVADGPEQQGYYTQEQVKEIIRYAEERNITVVPEIDMPGHAEAALYCYPEMGCFGKPAAIPQTGFTDVIFCAGKDSTLEFLKDILEEVCDLFPSEYIHLGGDEAPKGNWERCPDCTARIEKEHLLDAHELQLWFAAQMADFLRTKGKTAIFYEDVIHSGSYPLPDNIVIQWWNYRKAEDRFFHEALEKGYKVVCSPNYYTYLNFPETPWRGYEENRTFGIEDAYLRNPLEKALSEDNPLVMGAECALWTDYGLTEDMLFQRLLPRIKAIAQLMWGGQEISLEELESGF